MFGDLLGPERFHLECEPVRRPPGLLTLVMPPNTAPVAWAAFTHDPRPAQYPSQQFLLLLDFRRAANSLSARGGGIAGTHAALLANLLPQALHQG